MIKPKLGNIWWLASYPKSGNTWVRMFLTAYLTGEPVNINADYQFVVSDISPTLFPPSKDVYEHLFTFEENVSKFENLCLKTHNANVKVNDIQIIPMKKTNGGVYLVRDPRDVVLSLASHYNIKISAAIDFMNDDTCTLSSTETNKGHVLGSWSTHVKSWMKTNLVIFKYEDLIDYPREAFLNIIKTLYLPNHGTERFNFALKQASFENLQKQEEKNGFKEVTSECKFFRQGKAGQWKMDLGEKNINLIEKHHGDVMKEFKYL